METGTANQRLGQGNGDETLKRVTQEQKSLKGANMKGQEPLKSATTHMGPCKDHGQN
jgi:hypothetical protein